ncbi:MAG: ATP-dependent endonuclease [Bacteroidetes bacterium GWF2_33_16]|nr:MAG: ATP-dependent endonuclease [Bacteroidetes bacterium GWE2_32_14]OFY03812.1 MAG: ATP-dependent endonuclease [Bacteroidetes bacterium GWF2_33_16]
MLTDHIKKSILKNLGHEPTSDQLKLIENLSDFIIDNDSRKIFLVKGYAGTGKTTVISALVKTTEELNYKSLLLAPTGRAAKVLSSYSQKSAYTIHKKIYRQKSSKDGFGTFILNINLFSNTLFIVDEASMISNHSNDLSIFGSGQLLNDLLTFVYNDKNCKLILVGDTAQLPPVGIELSPALDAGYLSSYNYKVTEVVLTEVLRQSKESGVLFNATLVRNIINTKPVDFPKIQTDSFTDIESLAGNDLIEKISDSYDKYGLENTIIITRSNKRANQYNKGIRTKILWREEEIAVGDFIMIVKNNYFWIIENEDIDFIANGDIAEIVKIKKYTERYGFRFADVVLRFIDYNNVEIGCKIILDTLEINTAALSSEDNKKLFYNILEDYPDIKSKKPKYSKVKNNPYFNALQVKFAYAVTCHKAQGGQWKSVFVDHGYFADQMIDVELLRWLYTAITRTTDKLYLVNFNKRFFNNNE